MCVFSRCFLSDAPSLWNSLLSRILLILLLFKDVEMAEKMDVYATELLPFQQPDAGYGNFGNEPKDLPLSEVKVELTSAKR